MSRNEIIEKLKGILATVKGIEVVEINCDENTNLMTELGLNSIGMLYMVISIENAFGIRFADANMDELDTVGKVIDYIECAKA